MRRTDAHRVLALAVTAAGLLLSGPAAAFWPFTREPRVTLPDEKQEERITNRYEEFKVGRDSVLAAAADSADTAKAASPAASGPAAGQQIYRASDAASTPPPAPQETPAVSLDSLAAAAADAWDASSDSLAAPAGGDTLSAGPFAGLGGTPGAPGAPADPAAAAALAIGRGFAPDLKSTLATTNDAMRMSSNLAVLFNDPTGIVLSSSVGYGVDVSLTQNTEQHTSSLSNRIDMPLLQKSVRFGVSTTNSLVDQEGRSITNTATNTFSDTRGAEASLSAGRRLSDIPGLRSMDLALRGWSANVFFAHRVGARSQSTTAVQGTATGDTRHADTGNSYGVGVTFDRFRFLSVRARAGTARRDNKDRLSADQLEDLGSSSEGDTASVEVDVPKVGPIESVKLSFRTTEGSDTSVDKARSASGSQTGVIGNYVLDTHASLRQTVNLSLRYRQGPLTIGLSGNVGKNNDSYVIRANAFNQTRRYGWMVDSKLDFWKGSALVAKYEWSAADVNQDDRGVPNPSTRSDSSQKFYVEVSKPFTETLKVKLYGEIQLDQSFYEHEGPQGFGDRDELRQRVGIDLSGAISKNLRAQATLYLRTYDQSFIDPRRSSLSRDETEYIVRPSYTWTITPRITLRQSFGLASKVLEEVHAHDRDTLNRNHFMRTEMDARLTERLQMNLNWDYRIQDNGRYLSAPGSEQRFYSPTLRTKTDGLGVAMRYAVIRGEKLTFTSRQDSQRIYNFTFVDGERRLRGITDSGNLALGFESRFTLRDLKLDCRVVRNRSFNVSLNRRVYYNVDATLSYAF